MISQEFLSKTQHLPPDPLLVEALSHLKDGNTALDLGAGSGRDTRYLLEQGFQVTAVDIDPKSVDMLHTLPYQDRLTIVQSSFSDFNYRQYDLINARYALPFHHKAMPFEPTFREIVNALNPRGIFVGQLFGERDQWNTPDSTRTFHSMEQAEQLLEGLKVLAFREEERDGSTAAGTLKHWHVFHIIAQRP